jgi:hypothetical protein
MDLGLELFLPLHEAEVERGVRARRGDLVTAGRR